MLVASSRCLLSALVPIESEIKSTFSLLDVGRRGLEEDGGEAGGVGGRDDLNDGGVGRVLSTGAGVSLGESKGHARSGAVGDT